MAARKAGPGYPTGWVEDRDAVADYLAWSHTPLFGVTAAPIRDSGRGQVVLLDRALAAQLGGRFPVHLQTIGDCVSHGWGLGVDVLKAVQIAAGAREAFTGETATEVIYAGSRVEVGRGRLVGDGSVGAWAAKAVGAAIGTLVRGRYGAIDLTRYDGPRAREWGRRGRGVPDELEPRAREHPVRTVSLVTSYEEARDALANGYPVPVCSDQGFEPRRDAQGFARPRGRWGHCMLFLGVDDAPERPGLLVMNSWGPDWIGGPKRHDQPDGSFWVDAEVADRMLGAQDSYALSGYVGFPAQDLDLAQY